MSQRVGNVSEIWDDFNVADWLRDPALSACAPATRGVWFDLLCRMREAGRSGELRGTTEQLARLARCSTADIALALTDLQTTEAADVSPERNGIVTVINRRMYGDAKNRKAANDRQLRHRSKSRDGPDAEASRNGHENKTSDVRRLCIRKSLRASTSTSMPDVGEPEVKTTRSQTHDADTQIKISEEELPEILEQCRLVAEVVPTSPQKEQRRKDRSLIFKAVVLSRTRMSEDWLQDSLEAVRKHQHIGNKPRYFHGVLRSKCEAAGQTFNRLLRLVDVPESVLGVP